MVFSIVVAAPTSDVRFSDVNSLMRPSINVRFWAAAPVVAMAAAAAKIVEKRIVFIVKDL